jgi:hypothetical protein
MVSSIKLRSVIRKDSWVNGRVAVYAPNHPKANSSGYVLRSRFMMEQHVGRYLTEDEHVHHKNGNELDDRIDNFEILTRSEHIKLHYIEGSGPRQRELDYDKIEVLMNEGCGYKKIARMLGYNPNSVKSAVRVIKRG